MNRCVPWKLGLPFSGVRVFHLNAETQRCANKGRGKGKKNPSTGKNESAQWLSLAPFRSWGKDGDEEEEKTLNKAVIGKSLEEKWGSNPRLPCFSFVNTYYYLLYTSNVPFCRKHRGRRAPSSIKLTHPEYFQHLTASCFQDYTVVITPWEATCGAPCLLNNNYLTVALSSPHLLYPPCCLSSQTKSVSSLA